MTPWTRGGRRGTAVREPNLLPADEGSMGVWRGIAGVSLLVKSDEALTEEKRSLMA